jgi:putative inorganic carbon (hco3(-)) transporter
MEAVARLTGRVAPSEAAVPLIVLAAGSVVGVGAVASPRFAIAGAAGLLFLALASWNLTLGLCLFILLTFFDRSTAIQSGGITVVKLAGALLMLLWVLQVASARDRLPTLFRAHPLFSTALGVLAGWAMLSSLWAIDPHVALTGSEGSALRLVQGILLTPIVYTAVRERRHIWWLVHSFIGGAAFAAIIGFFGAYTSGSVNDGRLSGGFDDPNELAAVLLVALALSGAAFAAVGRRSVRWVYAGVALLLFYTLAQTDSQAGIVALCVALLLALVFSGRLRSHVVVAVMAFLLVSAAYYTFYTQPVALETITSQSNTGNRESLWSVAGRVAEDHAFAGVGAGNWVISAPPYTTQAVDLPRADLIGKQGQLVHNSYLQVLVELGVVGLMLFLAIIAAALAYTVRAAKTFEAAGDHELELLSRGLVIGLSAMLVAYFFATNQYEKQLWLLLGAGPAFLAVARSTRPGWWDVGAPRAVTAARATTADTPSV